MEMMASNTHVFRPSPLEEDEGVTHTVQRQFVDFHASVWGDYFINNPPPLDLKSESRIKQRISELVEKVRMTMRNTTELINKMHLIDKLQRLGISYHFKVEIDETLNQLNEYPIKSDELHVIALQFRLLRQNRYFASSDAFDKFKDENGNFKTSLSTDAKGLLSLYEAAHFGIPGEDIFNQAITFAGPLLQSILDDLEPTLKAMASSALETPIARKLSKVEAREYISIYQDDNEMRNDTVLELAKLDFHLLQLTCRKELRDMCLWWKELGLAEKLSYARDRVVECYFWGFGLYSELHNSRARQLAARFFALCSVTDDTFDIYGKPDELYKFNELIHRWDVEGADELPEYMQPIFHAIISYFKDVEDELVHQDKAYCVGYIREAMKKQIHSYWKESEWCNQGYVPTLKEYLHVSLISSTYPAVTCISYVGSGDEVIMDAFEWITSVPTILKATSLLGRVYNDIVSHEVEQKRVHVASAVECYMKEQGGSVQQAYKKLNEMIEDAWRTLNQEYLQLIEIPVNLMMPIINLGPASLCFYKYTDAFTHSDKHTKNFIELLFAKIISVQVGDVN